jgi:hypothetical protein
MRVEVTDPARACLVDGDLTGVIVSEQDGPSPHIVLEMSVSGWNDPAKVILNQLDLYTIMRLARGSNVDTIRDAVRVS